MAHLFLKSRLVVIKLNCQLVEQRQPITMTGCLIFFIQLMFPVSGSEFKDKFHPSYPTIRSMCQASV